MTARGKELGSKMSSGSYASEMNPHASIKDQVTNIKDQAAELTGSLKQEARTMYRDSEKKAREAFDQVKDYTMDTKDELTKSITNYVRHEPVKALAIAALAGAFFAFIMRK